MFNVSVALVILEDRESLPPGCSKTSRNLVFDVKMDFKDKARWVNYRHHNPSYPDTYSYSVIIL